MKVINLAMANIRKSKSATASLFIFIVVAALLLNIGLMVITQLSPFFDNKVEQLKDPHVSIMIDQASYNSSYEDYFMNYSGVTETEIEEIVIMDLAKFNFNHSKLTSSVALFNADSERMIGPLELIEKLNQPSDHDIYVPYSFKTNGGYKLGDHFTITYHDTDFQYRIAGFLETTVMGTTSIGVMKFMLPETSFQTLTEKVSEQANGMAISVLMEDKTQSSQLLNDFTKKFPQSVIGETTSYIMGLDIELVKNVNTLTINIIATILVAFAAIIVLISLIVIRFRVSNSIEDGMENIGVLKAIGYTSWQILSSIILQFIVIVLCASTVGIILSYVFMPYIGGVISSLSGLVWIQKFDIFINVISTSFVIFCVVMVTLLSAFRIRKILPVAALRGGIQTHSFRKNYFPLDKVKRGLHSLLAMKAMVVNAKQNMMILIIVSALTFAAIFSTVLYYNIASDKTAFVNLFGAEPGNVMIVVKSDADTKELMDNIEQMEHVRKVTIFDLMTTTIDDQTVYTNVTERYDQLENNIVYEGRQPVHENEISISWVVSNQINKGIGDLVEVEYGAKAKSYLVTGLSQSISNLGQVAAVTMKGMQQLQSDYKGTSLYVYLDDISNKDFIKMLQGQYGDHIAETLDLDDNIESQTGMYTAAVFAVMLLVLAITVLVVVMILYLVIKTMMIKRKKEFGVMKAIGYSTIQLMNQISISFLPVIMTAVTIGGVLGYFFTNPMLSVLLSSAGVKRLDFMIPFPVVLMPCVGILVLAYIVSMLVSQRIKNISAYGLITE
ncbi:ABC transporter permease [Robertmurraya massiliosenegalensis]|uniref:ABC transporter permease n=1 Tax=Robertmurraya massiliosenegalensis TaxID=1287657 RepID=UPI0011DD33F5|nr:ABC transporter permease [Robertmurraya massiliosenegalensis]